LAVLRLDLRAATALFAVTGFARATRLIAIAGLRLATFFTAVRAGFLAFVGLVTLCFFAVAISVHLLTLCPVVKVTGVQNNLVIHARMPIEYGRGGTRVP
jgi:hypothetical protein